MSGKTINGKPVFEAHTSDERATYSSGFKTYKKKVCVKRYLYYSDTDEWIVGSSENMEIGKGVGYIQGSGWILSDTKYADSPAWLPADERWRLYDDGEFHYGVLQLTCRHLPAAPPPSLPSPPPNSSSVS